MSHRRWRRNVKLVYALVPSKYKQYIPYYLETVHLLEIPSTYALLATLSSSREFVFQWHASSDTLLCHLWQLICFWLLHPESQSTNRFGQPMR